MGIIICQVNDLNENAMLLQESGGFFFPLWYGPFVFLDVVGIWVSEVYTLGNKRQKDVKLQV